MTNQLIQKLKKWITPEIKRVTIYEPNKAYMGMSKQTQALHEEHYKKIKCYKKCMK